MIHLPTQRLVRQLQRNASDAFFVDTAVLLQDVGSGAYDDNNTETVVTTSIPLQCSVTEKPSQENWKDYADIETVDAEIRFAGHSPTKGNRIKLTGRFESLDYADKTFEIVGIRNRDAFGYVCALKAVAI
jgi:hypothetical protein